MTRSMTAAEVQNIVNWIATIPTIDELDVLLSVVTTKMTALSVATNTSPPVYVTGEGVYQINVASVVTWVNSLTAWATTTAGYLQSIRNAIVNRVNLTTTTT